MKFIIMQFSPWSAFLPFRSKYPPQHSVLNDSPSMFLPRSGRLSFAPIRYSWRNYSSICFNLQVFLIWDGKTKDFGLNDSKHSANLIYSWFRHVGHPLMLNVASSTLTATAGHRDIIIRDMKDHIWWRGTIHHTYIRSPRPHRIDKFDLLVTCSSKCSFMLEFGGSWLV
jgi:hypothetical protein